MNSLRLRVLPALIPVNGREVELQVSATHIQWRYATDHTGPYAWEDLIAISDLIGEPGPAVELRSNGAYIQYRVVGTADWTNIIPLADITGAQGIPGIQGEQGEKGDQGDQGDAGVVQALVAGAGITIDNTDPANPIVAAGSQKFANVAAMVASTGLAVGDIVETAGYHSAALGGGNAYEIVAASTGTADGGAFINLTGSSGQAKALFPDGRPNLLQWGVKADKATDDTTAAQAALDWNGTKAATLYGLGAPRSTRQCYITQLTFWGAGACFDMDGMVFTGIATTSKTSCLQFKQGLGFTRNIVVGSSFNPNYQCAIHRYTNDLNTYYPGRGKFRDITISGFAIGLVVGGRPNQGLVTHAQGSVQADGVATDAPVSEEFWEGLDIQDCPRGLFFNQPNGKVTFSNSNLVSAGTGYNAVNPDVEETALTVWRGELTILGGAIEALHTSNSRLGILLSGAHVNIVGAVVESQASPFYMEGGARLRISKVQNWGLNGDSAFGWVHESWFGELVFSDMFLLRGGGYSGVHPVIKSVSSASTGSFAPNLNGMVTFHNVEFGDCNFTQGATYNPHCAGVRAVYSGNNLKAKNSASTYVRQEADRIIGPNRNLLSGVVDLAADTITAYGANGNASSGGWSFAVSGSGTNSWGKITTGAPSQLKGSEIASLKLGTTALGAATTATSPKMSVEPNRVYLVQALVKGNAAGGGVPLIVRALFYDFADADASIPLATLYSGDVAVFGSGWNPVTFWFKTPPDCVKMALFLYVESGAAMEFRELQIR